MSKPLLIWKIVLASALLTAFPAVGSTQSAVESSRVDVGLKGLSGEEVEARFGAPDRRQADSDGRETWSYGRSLILFQGGRVSAWSNTGELERRSNVRELHDNNTPNLEVEYSSTAWSNPWTPKEGVEADEVVLELMEGEPGADNDKNSGPEERQLPSDFN